MGLGRTELFRSSTPDYFSILKIMVAPCLAFTPWPRVMELVAVHSHWVSPLNSIFERTTSSRPQSGHGGSVVEVVVVGDVVVVEVVVLIFVHTWQLTLLLSVPAQS